MKTLKTDTKNPLVHYEEKRYSQDESECQAEPPMERENNETMTDNKNPITQILDTLDEDGYDKLCNLNKTSPKNATATNVQDKLLDIIKSGANEFEKKNGRPMSYIEMRCAYG